MVVKLEAAAAARAAVVAARRLDAAALAAPRDAVQVHGRSTRAEQVAVCGLGLGFGGARDGGREGRIPRRAVVDETRQRIVCRLHEPRDAVHGAEHDAPRRGAPAVQQRPLVGGARGGAAHDEREQHAVLHERAEREQHVEQQRRREDEQTPAARRAHVQPRCAHSLAPVTRFAPFWEGKRGVS